MDWTVEIWKLDRRFKEGMVLWSKTDFTSMTLDAVERANPRRPGFVVKIFETYVTRKNIMTGEEYQERYDTPWFASPSSETYWNA